MNIMKEAHKLTREIKKEFPNIDYKFQLGLCISYLHKNKEAIKVLELKGTEKQVKWGNSIRENLLNKCDNEEIKSWLNSIMFAEIFNDLRDLRPIVNKSDNERKNEELKKYIITLIKEAIKSFINKKVKRNNVNELFPVKKEAFFVFDINVNYTFEEYKEVMEMVYNRI